MFCLIKGKLALYKLYFLFLKPIPMGVPPIGTGSKYLTPDGMLTGVAQSNRGGISLQQSDYRVISQMGMGLMAQLAAALD